MSTSRAVMLVHKLLIVFSVVLTNSNVLTSPQNYKGIPSSGREGIKTASGQIAFPDDLNIMEEDVNAGKMRMHHYHHHHPHYINEGRDDEPEFEHDLSFHREHGIPMPLPLPLPDGRYHPEEDDQSKPEKTPLHGNYDGKNNRNSSKAEEDEIPVSFVLKFNEYSVNDLLLNFVEGDSDIPDTQTSIQNRFGSGEAEERSAAISPKAAGCAPELTTIQIAPAKHDSNVLYFPQCTRIERCSCEGCCSHELLSCQPTAKELVSFKVLKTQYKGVNSKLRAIQKDIIQVEKHTKCECACRIKEENCTTYQVYQKSQCKCVCANTDEEKKCQKAFAIKLWNSNSCSCQCRQTMECSTGAYFDTNECKCLPKVVKLHDEVEPFVAYETA